MSKSYLSPWRKGAVRVMTGRGERFEHGWTHDVFGLVRGEESKSARRWTLTHMPSGLSCGTFYTRQSASEFAAAMQRAAQTLGIDLENTVDAADTVRLDTELRRLGVR